ncbi:hypothetical protein BaRGS_00024564 [Batillaria attramentaria]|uniref:Ig-like domain-containing protein n=1 Tax=Batillaria attramentaria TaxID=370345 RepID=A0ABD0KAP2_9CAEN
MWARGGVRTENGFRSDRSDNDLNDPDSGHFNITLNGTTSPVVNVTENTIAHIPFRIVPEGCDGDSVSLECTWDPGYPQVYNAVIQLPNGTALNKQNDTQQNTSYTLDNVTCEDAGNFRCNVPEADDNKTVTLLVKCAPVFTNTPVNKTVVSGLDAVLAFRIRSYTKQFTDCRFTKILYLPFENRSRELECITIADCCAYTGCCHLRLHSDCDERASEMEECDMIENPVYGTASDFIRRSAESPYTEVKDCIRSRDASPTHSDPNTTGDRKPDGEHMDPSSTTAREDPNTSSHCDTNEDGAPSHFRRTVVSEDSGCGEVRPETSACESPFENPSLEQAPNVIRELESAL